MLRVRRSGLALCVRNRNRSSAVARTPASIVGISGPREPFGIREGAFASAGRTGHRTQHEGQHPPLRSSHHAPPLHPSPPSGAVELHAPPERGRAILSRPVGSRCGISRSLAKCSAWKSRSPRKSKARAGRARPRGRCCCFGRDPQSASARARRSPTSPDCSATSWTSSWCREAPRIASRRPYVPGS
jgi:hypothetical protein